ncbi:MAG TPA: hypothetical protein VFU86_21220 [Terriglobales bacterium]|nr:hypothetical protein [Terriglobales bacterium]
MRKLVFMLGLLCLCVGIAAAQSQGKVSNGWSCAKPTDMKTIDVGDQPGHTYTVVQFKCTSTKGEYAGVKEKEGTGTEFEEVKNGKLTGHGIFVETLANGDKATFTYQPVATIKDGKMTTLSNHWQATNATGKFKGMKASGTCTGTGTPEGGSSLTCSGTYTLAK